MNEAHELLRRALERMIDTADDWDLYEEIRIYLANQETAKDEAVACKRCNGTGVIKTGEIYCYPDGPRYRNGPVVCVDDCPDCHPAKPERKPMTEEEIFELLKGNGLYCKVSFFCGVQAAEKHHGIGEQK